MKPALTAAAAVLILTAAAGAAHVFGLSAYRIQTGSMAPDFPPGTIVVDTARQPPAPNRPITFVADGALVTHILVGYNPDGSLLTRGTANPSNDHWRREIFPRDVRGMVLFGVTLLAPSFWLGWHAAVAAAGLGAVLTAAVLGYRSTRPRGFVPRSG